jgi:hypothetical protein
MSQTFYTALLVVIGIGSTGTVVTWFLSPLLMELLGVHGHLATEGVFMLRTLGLLVALSLVHNLYTSLLNSTQAYALTNLVTTCSYFVWSAGMVLSVRDHWGLRGAALSLLAQQVFSSALIGPRCLRFLSLRRPIFLTWPEARALLVFAGSTEGMSLIVLVNAQFNSLIVGTAFTLPDLA